MPALLFSVPPILICIPASHNEAPCGYKVSAWKAECFLYWGCLDLQFKIQV